jgi:hypothetical protein
VAITMVVIADSFLGWQAAVRLDSTIRRFAVGGIGAAADPGTAKY